MIVWPKSDLNDGWSDPHEHYRRAPFYSRHGARCRLVRQVAPKYVFGASVGHPALSIAVIKSSSPVPDPAGKLTPKYFYSAPVGHPALSAVNLCNLNTPYSSSGHEYTSGLKHRARQTST